MTNGCVSTASTPQLDPLASLDYIMTSLHLHTETTSLYISWKSVSSSFLPVFCRKNVLLREAHRSSRPQWDGHDAGTALLSHLGPCLQDQRVAATTAAGAGGDFQRAQLGGLGVSPGLPLPESEDLVQGVDTSTKVPWRRWASRRFW